MKIGSNVFDDDFISFSENKQTKYGYTPAAGLVGLSENCKLVECDPEAPARDNCERTCFSNPNECKCGERRCGTCYEKFCDCGSPVPWEGFYEDYLERLDSYNFGDPVRVCPNPGQTPLLALEGTAPPAEDCNCQKCPESGKTPPDKDADPGKCCEDKLKAEGPCTCLQAGGCGSVTIYRFGEPNITRVVVLGEEVPYYWGQDPASPGCYKCKCPEPTVPKKGDRKWWRCPEGEEEGCQETPNPSGTYETPELCDEKVASGECKKKWIGIWNYRTNVGKYECREKPDNFSKVGSAITEYDTEAACKEAISAEQGFCCALATPVSANYTGLGHCTSKWKCDASTVRFSGDPWKCRMTPFINGLGIHETEAECKKNCCRGDYDESVGHCSGTDFSASPFSNGQFSCKVSKKSNCTKNFSCGGCIIPSEWGQCPENSPVCGENEYRSYKVETTFLGVRTVKECGCDPEP
jgi:hypothetical protein